MSHKIENSEKEKNEKIEKIEKPEGQKKEGIKNKVNKVKNFFAERHNKKSEVNSGKEQGKETKEKTEQKQDSKNEKSQDKERKSWELTPEQKKEFDKADRERIDKYKTEQGKKSETGETGSENDSRSERVRERDGREI